MVTEQIGDQDGLKVKMELVGEKINVLQKEIADFQVLAMQAQMLTFSVKTGENVFQAEALKGNQIITYICTMFRPFNDF